MGTINSFEELEVWKKARELSHIIFKLSAEGKFYWDFALKDQIRRSSGSVMDNIAEGFGRCGNKEFLYFLYVSKGSLLEVISQLYRALDRSYIDESKFEDLKRLTTEINKKLNNLVKHLKGSDFRGPKYK